MVAPALTTSASYPQELLALQTVSAKLVSATPLVLVAEETSLHLVSATRNVSLEPVQQANASLSMGWVVILMHNVSQGSATLGVPVVRGPLATIVTETLTAALQPVAMVSAGWLMGRHAPMTINVSPAYAH